MGGNEQYHDPHPSKKIKMDVTSQNDSEHSHTPQNQNESWDNRTNQYLDQEKVSRWTYFENGLCWMQNHPDQLIKDQTILRENPRDSLPNNALNKVKKKKIHNPSSIVLDLINLYKLKHINPSFIQDTPVQTKAIILLPQMMKNAQNGQQIVLDFLQKAIEQPYNTIESCIKNETTYTQFMIKMINLYENRPTKIQELIQEEKNIEQRVFKQKIFQTWKDFIECIKSTQKHNQAKMKQTTLISYSQIEGSVRSQCTKNLAEFFIRIILVLIKQKLRKVFSKQIQLRQLWNQNLRKNFQFINLNFHQMCKPLNEPELNYYKQLLQFYLQQPQYLKKEESQSQSTNTTNEKKLNTMKKLWQFLSTKEMMKENLWKDIIKGDQIFIKVKQSYETGNINISLRDYYYCFIPRLLEILEQAKKQHNIQQVIANNQSSQTIKTFIPNTSQQKHKNLMYFWKYNLTQCKKKQIQEFQIKMEKQCSFDTARRVEEEYEHKIKTNEAIKRQVEIVLNLIKETKKKEQQNKVVKINSNEVVHQETNGRVLEQESLTLTRYQNNLNMDQQ